MSPGWEKIKHKAEDPVCNVCGCFHARNRVPTVPEKQVARWETKRSIDCKSMWVDTTKQYALMMQGSLYLAAVAAWCMSYDYTVYIVVKSQYKWVINLDV